MTPNEIRAAVESGDPATAKKAMDAIPRFPMEPWAREIFELLADKPGHPLRYEAMLCLNSFARPAAVFTSALEDPDPLVRTAAFCSLAIRGRPEDWERLIAGTADPSPELRQTVLGCLLEWIDGSEIDRRPPLADCLRDGGDPRLRALVPRLRAALEAAVAREADPEARELARACLGRLRADT